MKNQTELIEYLFLDKPRIERYFEQLSAPVKYDKQTFLKVALNLMGPSVEGTQSPAAREFSFNEKLQKMVDHMEKKQFLLNTRPNMNHAGAPGPGRFVREIVCARRSRIVRDEKILNIWVSLQPEVQTPDSNFPVGALYLIEDYRGQDEYSRTYSGYSSLGLLADELEWVGDTPLADPIDQLKRQDDAVAYFARDPIGSLKSIGAEFGPERYIHTIYRYRASCVDITTNSFTTVGYPLIINEA